MRPLPGGRAELEAGFAKVRSAGVNANAIAAAASRQASLLHRLRLVVESGTPVREAAERASPTIHFSRMNLVQAALSSWSAARLERLIVQLGEAALDVRQRAKLAYPIVQRALLLIALSARRGA